jgi:hypothetical protein
VEFVVANAIFGDKIVTLASANKCKLGFEWYYVTNTKHLQRNYEVEDIYVLTEMRIAEKQMCHMTVHTGISINKQK